jgi:hypothetical protein
MPGEVPILVPFPPEVIEAVDKIVPRGERTAFLVDLTRHEIRRRRLEKILTQPEPIWKPEDHPDIDDSGAWVRQMRHESELRFEHLRDTPGANE